MAVPVSQSLARPLQAATVPNDSIFPCEKRHRHTIAIRTQTVTLLSAPHRNVTAGALRPPQTAGQLAQAWPAVCCSPPLLLASAPTRSPPCSLPVASARGPCYASPLAANAAIGAVASPSWLGFWLRWCRAAGDGAPLRPVVKPCPWGKTTRAGLFIESYYFLARLRLAQSNSL